MEEKDLINLFKFAGIFVVSMFLLSVMCQPKVKVIETKCNKEVQVKVIRDTIRIVDTVCVEQQGTPIPKGAPTDWVGGNGNYVVYAKLEQDSSDFKYNYYLKDSSKRGFAMASSEEYEVGDILDMKKR